MHILADLHIHSKYSRATSRALELPHIALWAKRKGIHVIGTGDLSHPSWHKECQEQLVPAEPGLYRLHPTIEQTIQQEAQPSVASLPVRFMLTVEMTTIHKTDTSNQALHQLVTFPHFDAANALFSRLAQYGNTTADGQPILALSPRDLLEMILETAPGAHLIPSHIWNPTFSVFGAKHGRATIEESYGDLTPHIFALETGISSSPEMSRRWSALDSFTLLSNSNAHSPSKIGRNATRFSCELSYEALFDAIQIQRAQPEQSGMLGTIASYPEASKYFLDGHRSCKIQLDPQNSNTSNGICPVCKKPFSIGVLHRIEQLVDRPPEEAAPSLPVNRLIGLTAILSELFDLGVRTRKVQRQYQALIAQFGTEYSILQNIPEEELKKAHTPLFSEAIMRMRRGEVTVTPGYDGEHGRVSIFREDESKATSFSLFPTTSHAKEEPQLLLFKLPQRPLPPPRTYQPGPSQQLGLFAAEPSEQQPTSLFAEPTEQETFSLQAPRKTLPPTPAPPKQTKESTDKPLLPTLKLRPPRQPSSVPKQLLLRLNTEQRTAVLHWGSPMLLTAGPGTGKTLTLTHRVAYLVATTKVSPRRMLILTHTPQSALKLEARLHQLLHGPLGIRVCTLFEFCRDLQEDEELVGDEQYKPPRLLSEMESATLLQELAALRAPNLTETELHRIYRQIAWAKQQLLFPNECATRAMTKASENTPLDTFLATTHRFFLPLYQDYQNILRQEHLIDLEDLLIDTAQRLLQDVSYRTAVQEKYHSIHVDDYQELGHAAQIILQQLALENTDFCAFSDPDQAIYQSSPGVRHSVKAFIQSFSTPTRKAMSCGLWRNYRTPETYLEAAEYVIQAQAHPKRIKPLAMVSGGQPIQVVVNQHDREEAIWVTELIRSLHNQPTEPGSQHPIQFEDIAILYRQNEQRPLLIQALKDASIPFRTHHPSSDIRSRPYAALAACWQCINVGLNDWLSFRLLVSVCKDLGTSVWPHLRTRLHTANSLTAVLLEEEDKQLLLPPERDMLLSLRDTIDTLSQTVKQSHIERTSAAQVMAQLIDTITPFLRKNAQLTKEQRNQLIEQATAAGSLHQWHRTLVLSRYAAPPTNQQEHVALLPIQAAKGLEYKVIIVVGCEAEWMPGQVATEKQREREDRLVYVALTRARHTLFLSRARLRTLHGKKTSTTPAPFLERCAPYLQMTTPGQWKQERNEPPAQCSFLEEIDT